MKKIVLVVLLVVGSIISNAQQLQHYTQYMINGYVLNPAISGSKDVFDANLNIRDQWVGITDAPRTFIFSVNGPLNEKMGIGGYVFTDVAGPTRRTGSKLSYSYHLKLNDDLRLSFGVSAGILQYTMDFSQTKTNEINDPATTSGLSSALLPDAGAGLYLYGERLYFSVSSPQILPINVRYFDDYQPSENKLTNHLYAFGGYRIPVGDVIVVEPSVMAKYVNPAPVQFDASLRVMYNNMIWLGASYRSLDAVALMAGYKYQDNLLVGYSYDITTTGLKNYNNGTHEIMVGISFMNRHKKDDSAPQMQ